MRLVERAADPLAYLLARAAARFDLDSIEGSRRAAEWVLGILSRVPETHQPGARSQAGQGPRHACRTGSAFRSRRSIACSGSCGAPASAVASDRGARARPGRSAVRPAPASAVGPTRRPQPAPIRQSELDPHRPGVDPDRLERADGGHLADSSHRRLRLCAMRHCGRFSRRATTSRARGNRPAMKTSWSGSTIRRSAPWRPSLIVAVGPEHARSGALARERAAGSLARAARKDVDRAGRTRTASSAQGSETSARRDRSTRRPGRVSCHTIGISTTLNQRPDTQDLTRRDPSFRA